MSVAQGADGLAMSNILVLPALFAAGMAGEIRNTPGASAPRLAVIRIGANPHFSQRDVIFATGAAGEILTEDLGGDFSGVLSRRRLLRVCMVRGTHGVRTLAREIVARAAVRA